MKVLMYNHGSCYNHGCEAILRTVSGIIDVKNPGTEYTVSSFRPNQDEEYIDTSDGRFSFVPSDRIIGLSFEKRKFVVGALTTVLHNVPFFKSVFRDTVKAAKESSAIISVGGDNYSYGKSAELTTIDRKLRKYCPVSVLWGCSINPEYLNGKEYEYKVKSLRDFSLITARESITYDALVKLGFTNVKLYPDPAFTLEVKEPEEKMFDNDRDIVGINLSPLIIPYESEKGMAVKCYAALVRDILEKTDFNVAFISHVRSKTSDDTNAASLVIKEVGENPRIKIFDRGSAPELKGYISKCRFFVAARTHASIAAYSTGVPTLVVGYSVKSTGIAKDIFGSSDRYVVPMPSLEKESDLSRLFFENIYAREDEIRNHYGKVMPDYIRRAYLAGDEIAALIEKSERRETE